MIHSEPSFDLSSQLQEIFAVANMRDRGLEDLMESVLTFLGENKSVGKTASFNISCFHLQLFVDYKKKIENISANLQTIEIAKTERAISGIN